MSGFIVVENCEAVEVAGTGAFSIIRFMGSNPYPDRLELRNQAAQMLADALAEEGFVPQLSPDETIEVADPDLPGKHAKLVCDKLHIHLDKPNCHRIAGDLTLLGIAPPKYVTEEKYEKLRAAYQVLASFASIQRFSDTPGNLSAEKAVKQAAEILGIDMGYAGNGDEPQDAPNAFTEAAP